MKFKGSRTTPVRSAARSGEGAGENASLFAEGIALHISDTGSRAVERDCRRRKKQATPGGKRRLFERCFAHAWALTCLGIRFRVCRTWSLRNVFRVLKKAPTVGKSVVGIDWDACLWADVPSLFAIQLWMLERKSGETPAGHSYRLSRRSIFPPCLLPDFCFPSDILFSSREAFPNLAPACALNMPPSATPKN